METLENKTISNQKLLIGAAALIVGFAALSLSAAAWWGLFVGGAFAWWIVFGRTSKAAFTMPKKIWIIPIGVALYFVYGVVAGLLLTRLGFAPAANPATGHLGSLLFKIPFMLLGEELMGIGVLEAARSKGLSLTASTFLSAALFGLMHVFVYWDGSLLSTLLHVLLIQGVARLIFNYIYLISDKSILGSFLCHMLVDYIALAV